MVTATANQVESQHRRNPPRISCKIINGLIARLNSSYGDSFDISGLANILMLLILQRQKKLVVALEVINCLSTTHRDV